ncbi:hypothetical protein EG329_007409 [Mollisiaceae sp. DMI_Dod_QoI]|nr:hypothetical protein EG329_007409 [Helotiales sp. DMI_Dod_QoI]
MVTSIARAGDFVYIHYFGHGTKKRPFGEFTNKSTGDLALVLLTKEKRETCLWGSELACLLNAMVSNGLVITLVLDCCFSASAYRRDDPSVRFLPYNAAMDSEYSADPERSPKNEMSLYRDVSMLPNWLMSPDRYVILTACGPHEEAAGLKSGYGALSYFLLRTVKCVGLAKRHEDIYDHLRAEFQCSGSRQNPVFYGNRNQGFFGQVNSDITATAIPIIVKQDKTLELQAGYAHGVETNDQLVLYPFGCVEGDPRSQGNSIVAKVASTRALTSDLERLDLPSVRTKWIAIALTRFSLRRFPIRLLFMLPHRDEWLTALGERSLNVHIDTDKHPFAFDVVLNNGEYQVLDESGHEIDNLISMPQDQTDISQIGNVLEHLARFRLIKDLVNKAPTNSFRNSFEIQIFSKGKYFGPNFLIEIEHDDIAKLVVKNQGDSNLYVFVYDLDPCWEVENVFRGTYIVSTP